MALQLKAEGIFDETLRDIYECGRAFNWTASAANLGATFRANTAVVQVGPAATAAAAAAAAATEGEGRV
jgi:hypothetical protein